MNKLLQYAVTAVVLGGLLFGWVRERERAAVAKAELRHYADSVRVADSVRATVAWRADSAAKAEVATLREQQTVTLAMAQASGRRAKVFADQLHQLVDSNAVMKALVDSLEAAHQMEVTELHVALARSDSIGQVEHDRAEALAKALRGFQLSNAALLKRLDEAQRAGERSLGKQLVDAAPWVLAVGAVTYAIGRNQAKH